MFLLGGDVLAKLPLDSSSANKSQPGLWDQPLAPRKSAYDRCVCFKYNSIINMTPEMLEAGQELLARVLLIYTITNLS